MDEEVFSQDSVKDVISRHYVPVRYDVDKDASLFKQYKLPGIPAMLILDENEKELKRMVGFHDADTLVSILKEIAEE